MNLGGAALTAQTDRHIDPHRVTEYMHTAMKSLVEALESAPQTPALALAILPAIERQRVIYLCKRDASGVSAEQAGPRVVPEQVERTPDAGGDGARRPAVDLFAAQQEWPISWRATWVNKALVPIGCGDLYRSQPRDGGGPAGDSQGWRSLCAAGPELSGRATAAHAMRMQLRRWC